MKKKILRVLVLLLAAVIPVLCTMLVSRANGAVPPSPSVHDSEEATAAAADESVSPPSVLSAAESTSKVSVPNGNPAHPDDAAEEEMRGVWIPYMSLQLKEGERDESHFRQKIDTMLDNCVRHDLNTVVVQVRPFGDALYPSRWFPWSHILTGTQGQAVDYDPLDIIVRAAHHRHLAVHAWVNPFRISTGQTPPSLAKDNPYCRWQNDSDPDNDDYTFTYDGGIYYNPAYPAVRQLIIDGVRELVANYPLDGVQIDDYFYPSEEEGYDRQSYEAYRHAVSEGCQPLSLGEWRKTNVNMLLAGMYRAIHQTRGSTVFGIAPQCNFDNNEKLSADVLCWCRDNGYMDYLCPQLYVSMNHPVFPFKALADRWQSLVTDRPIKLYFGLALYKVGTDADGGTWLSDVDNLSQEIAYLRQSGVDGYLLYAYDYLENATPLPLHETH